jgi:hypothetical protein
MFKKAKQSDLAQKVVVDGQPVAAKPSRKLNLKAVKKHKKTVLIVGALLLVGGAGLLLYNYHNNQPPYLTANCTLDSKSEACLILIKASGEIADSSKLNDMTATVEKIKSIKGYEKDPNLLYVLTVYYAYLGDSQNANHYNSLLYKTYKAKRGYNVVIRNKTYNPDDINQFIKTTKLQEQEVQKNSFTVQEPK